MPKSVTAKVFSAIPARDDNNMIMQSFAFQHAQDCHARARLAIIVFQGAFCADQAPAVMCSLGEFPVLFQLKHEVAGSGARAAWPAGYRISGPAILDDIVENAHGSWIGWNAGRGKWYAPRAGAMVGGDPRHLVCNMPCALFLDGAVLS